MSRTGGNVSNLHPRLNVVWLGSRERASLSAALGRHGTVVDGVELEERTRAAAQERSDRERPALASAEDELRGLERRRSSAELALADLLHEQERLREAADWCELQPEQDRAATGRIDAYRTEVEDHSRVARDATRKLERVLEQRAAAEAALEEAHRELAGLGATGIDETDVRRQMEAASQELRAASTEYQEAMTDLARRQSALADAEEVAARAAEEPAPTFSEGNQLEAMGRALSAKFAPRGAPPPTDAGEPDVDRIRGEVRMAQERADEAAHRLSTARHRISGFETELTARSNDGDARTARHEAALALEAQVSSVERQLSDAEAAARAEVDGATRAMSRAELALERERQDSRQRRRQLGELLALVPAGDRPPVEDDIVDHAGTIATALRELIGPMQPDIDQARTGIEVLRSEEGAKAADLDRRRSRLDAVVPEDRQAALAKLFGGDHGLVVLDDLVGTADGAALRPEDLDAVDATAPVVVLTEDAGVAAWAIELPDERGRIAHPSQLWSAVEVDLTTSDASTATDPHPEPSSSR